MPIPEFIVSLRKQIGHDLLWLPGVTAVVLRGEDEDGEVLLVRRSDNGQWTPVTGIVDPGEHPEVAAVREVREEATVSCVVEALVGVDVSPVITHDNGDLAQYLNHTYRCRYAGGEAAVGDDESTEVRWFPLARLPKMAEASVQRIRAAASGPSLSKGI